MLFNDRLEQCCWVWVGQGALSNSGGKKKRDPGCMWGCSTVFRTHCSGIRVARCCKATLLLHNLGF